MLFVIILRLVDYKTLYGNMVGADYCENGKEMCFIAQKGGNSNDII